MKSPFPTSSNPEIAKKIRYAIGGVLFGSVLGGAAGRALPDPSTLPGVLLGVIFGLFAAAILLWLVRYEVVSESAHLEQPSRRDRKYVGMRAPDAEERTAESGR